MVVATLDVNGVFQQYSPLEAQLQATLNVIPFTWYAGPSGQLSRSWIRPQRFLRSGREIVSVAYLRSAVWRRPDQSSQQGVDLVFW